MSERPAEPDDQSEAETVELEVPDGARMICARQMAKADVLKSLDRRIRHWRLIRDKAGGDYQETGALFTAAFQDVREQLFGERLKGA